MKNGDIVIFKNPHPSELDENGKQIPMRIVEMRGNRVLVEALIPNWNPDLLPQAVYKTNDLVRVFKDFTSIQIPTFLDVPAWLDESWGNDVTAHVRFDGYTGINYELWVWVHPEDKTEREDPEYPRFVVTVYEKDNGDELESIEAETEAECQKAIEEMMWKLDLLAENAKNAGK